MKCISPKRKAAILAKLPPPYSISVAAVAQMKGISEATFYDWRSQTKTTKSGRQLLSMTAIYIETNISA